MGVRKTEEKIVDGVREIKRVPNVPNHSMAHPLYKHDLPNLGELFKKPKK
jgi:hypothetical protein